MEESFAVAPQANSHSACVRWSIPNFSALTSKSTRCLWSKYFDVGGYDCRVLVYPAGAPTLWSPARLTCQKIRAWPARLASPSLQTALEAGAQAGPWLQEGQAPAHAAPPAGLAESLAPCAHASCAGPARKPLLGARRLLRAAPVRAGDSQAVKGYVSIYVQVTDPKNAPKWDCFAAHRLSIRHASDPGKSLSRDSWHRFSAKKKSHGWCEFAPVSSILDPRQVRHRRQAVLPPCGICDAWPVEGPCAPCCLQGRVQQPAAHDAGGPQGFATRDTVTVVAEVSLLSETHTFVRDPELSPSGLIQPSSADVLGGKFTWKARPALGAVSGRAASSGSHSQRPHPGPALPLYGCTGAPPDGRGGAAAYAAAAAAF